MKKIILTLALTFSLFTVSIPKSHAIVGIVTGNLPIAIIGLSGGTVVGPLCIRYCYDLRTIFFVSMFSYIGGTIALDGDSNDLQFMEISNAKAISLGLTTSEIKAYSENKDQLSMIFNEINSKLNKNSTREDSKELWDSYSEILNQEALSAAKKFIDSEIKNKK